MLMRLQRNRIAHTSLVGTRSGTATLENSLETFLKHATAILPNNCTSEYLSHRNKIYVPHKKLCVNVCSSFFYNSKKARNKQMSFTGWMIKHCGVPSSHKEEWTPGTHSYLCLSLQRLMLHEHSQFQKAAYGTIPLSQHCWNNTSINLGKIEAVSAKGKVKRGGLWWNAVSSSCGGQHDDCDLGHIVLHDVTNELGKVCTRYLLHSSYNCMWIYQYLK